MSFQKMGLLGLTLGIASLFNIVAATPAINLSGSWKLNVEESTFGVLPAPVSRTINITHKEPLLKLEISEDTGSEKRSQILEYTTEGKICINKVRGSDFRSTLRWDGSTLVIETEGFYQGREFRATDRWSSSPDQKTITIERRASNNSGETHQKLILEKQ